MFISWNSFTEFPDQITTLVNLEWLYLSHNSIKSIPSTISVLTSLEKLSLSFNQLQSLPNELSKLHLRSIDLNHNQLDNFFQQNELTSVLRTSIRTLLLNSNKLTHLPSSIGLYSLEELDISCNQLKSIDVIISISSLQILRANLLMLCFYIFDAKNSIMFP